MRPRRIRRGERREHNELGTQNHSFNAATPNSAWRTWLYKASRYIAYPLQCGHAEFGVENREAADEGRGDEGASMRPRRIRRGEQLQLADQARLDRLASMRPRRIRRGERPAHPRASRTGQGFNAA